MPKILAFFLLPCKGKRKCYSLATHTVSGVLAGKKSTERKVKYQPVDPEKIAAAKRERQKEVKMWDLLQEMAAYAFFLWVLLTISYGTRDPNCYLIRQALENHFVQPTDAMLSYNLVRLPTDTEK